MAESIETKHENWLRVVWGLLYVREGLQGYVDTKGKEQYETFMNNVNGKCNNQTCNQCQVNSKCQNGTTKVTEKSRFRPGHFCDEMNKNIQNNHVRIKPLWTNTDSTKWQDPHDGYWEVAKCYLSTSGYLDKTGPNQVRDIRNKTLHDACYELDGQTADICLDKMITVLEDQQELIYDAFAKQAAIQIRKIKAKTENPPAIMTEPFRKLLRMNLNVEMALTEIEKLMNDRLRKNLQQLIVDGNDYL
ncbi:hypothetical protein MAR_003009 [Mya arenaria]|uniref:DZIP3-like HEPN domain-containing protein n=1 Tax=Mya arenaria TaxID=6604 RepID=A0ABY7GE08_MYAAR|nr:hypothetical protein MAR_002994 [Mya arenaria]WAR29441.1 hypothetical protein MAR_003009 [Mya arenaria]